MLSNDPPASDRSLFATPADAAALDAVFGELPRGSDLVREDAAVRLLGLLGDVPVDSADRQLLVEVTLARVLRAQDRAGRILTRPEKPTLTEESAHALDALMEAPGEAVTDTAQAARVAALCELLDAGVLAPTEADRARLVGATLERIQSQLDQRQRRFRLSPEPGSATSGGRGMLRLADLVSIAAVFLIATAIAWPFLVSIREQARETQCASNLSRAALGMSMYAADHQGRLPRAEAGLFGGSWWNVGEASRSHSANLYTVVRRGYASLHDLSCPGNAFAPVRIVDPDARDWRTPEEVSFSYQLFAVRTPLWGENPRQLVLADKSPVVDRARRGERFDAEASSLNHLGHGQSLMFGDGSVRFYVRPVLENGDNVWLPASFERSGRLTGREMPASDTDAFVGP